MDRRFTAIYLSSFAFFVIGTSSCLSMTVSTVATTSTTPTPCFQCENKKSCINPLLRCDGLDDCGDYSDEKNCSCDVMGKFKCDNGRCIPNTWVCDFEDDCYDNSDERHCNDSYFCTGQCDHACDVVKDKNGMRTGKCRCYGGYFLRPDGKTCVDIDECTKKGVCERKCINTLGSYKCECGAGFTKGYDNKSCSDIDECAVNNGGCEHLCHNTYGSYDCRCKKGYIHSYRNKKYCHDIDECALGIPNCHTCKNVAGGYRCECDDGYNENANKTACYDKNECSKRNGGCEHICHNLAGSYKCACKPGFEATYRDSKFCRDIDECASNNGKGPCQHHCKNTQGDYECTCSTGYKLNKDGQTCDDIDECQRKGTCDHICINAPGSFYCACRDKFFLAKDKKTCRDTVDYSACGFTREKIEQTRRWKDTNKNTWPWVVHFTTTFHIWSIIDQFPLQGVLGVILNDKWVLTAGHSLGDESYNVHTNDGNSIRVSEIIPYSTCDVKAGQCKSDIALVKLASPIKFTKTVRPICIPGQAFMQQVFLSDRNASGMILRRRSGLQKRTVRVRRPKDCSHYPFSKHMICAGDLRNVCAADSGSPLMFTRKFHSDNPYITKKNKQDQYIAYLAGVLSWGTDILDGDDDTADESCDKHPRFLAFTNIGRYLKWIKDKTGTTPHI